jgi:hypothetical protein
VVVLKTEKQSAFISDKCEESVEQPSERSIMPWHPYCGSAWLNSNKA